MDIKAEEYIIQYLADSGEILCSGSLLLSGTEEYAPILDLMLKAAEEQAEQLNLNVTQLEFLNSSGINTMTKFVINVRNRKHLKLSVTGLEGIPWQVRLLKNLQRLMPTLELRMQ